MAGNLAEKFKDVRITKVASPESLCQSAYTRDILRRVGAQIRESRYHDWPVGQPSEISPYDER